MTAVRFRKRPSVTSVIIVGVFVYALVFGHKHDPHQLAVASFALACLIVVLAVVLAVEIVRDVRAIKRAAREREERERQARFREAFLTQESDPAFQARVESLRRWARERSEWGWPEPPRSSL